MKYSDILKDQMMQGRLAQRGKETTEGKWIPTNTAGWKNKLIFYKTDGRTSYIYDYASNPKETYHSKFNPKTNPYKLLEFLTKNPNQKYPVKDLVKLLNDLRSDVNFPDNDRRVRDTIQIIRKRLKLLNEHDFFIIDKKEYGIKCNVELRD